MGKEEVLLGLLMELRRGTIVLSVLSQLEEAKYGYNLVTLLSEYGISVETNTLYPLLRRLETQGLLKSEWETGGNKPRKYYMITDEGREIYGILKLQWQETTESMNKLLGIKKEEQEL